MIRLFALAFATLSVTVIGGCETHKTGAVPTGKLAGIPLGEFGSIRDWRGDGAKGVYIESDKREWYYATFQEPCVNLPSVVHIEIRTSPPFPIDHFDAIQMLGEVCFFKTFDNSPGPPSSG